MELTNFGLRETKTRQMVLSLLKNAKEPITAEDIYKALIDEKINLSTIYRSLNSFLERNIITKEIRQDGKALYHYLQKEHRHVLICTTCNKKIYLDNCPYQEIDKTIYVETGFTIKHHNIELYGLCKECAEKESLKLELRS